MKSIALALSCGLVSAVLYAGEGAAQPTGPAGAAGHDGLRTVADDAVGVELAIPASWRVHPDPVLFDTYGFAVFADDGPKWGGHERSPVARIARAYQLAPGQIGGMVDDLVREYAEFPLQRYDVAVGPGLTGTAVSGLPGTDPYTVVYVADRGRVYRIGLWTAEPGLDPRARALLAGLRFREPKRTIGSLGLTPVEQATYAQPPPEQLARNARAHAERVAAVAAEGGEPAEVEATHIETAAGTTPPSTAACESGQPSGLFWQTVWDYTNRFYSGYTTRYSGTYYNLRPNDPGWSAMSGNYGSWWGQNYHIRKCEPYLLNQYYANDWPAHFNANGYSATKGTVEWAGWDSDGYYTLGNYVVVRNGSYRALMAHFTSLAPGITWGATVGMNTIIGYVGRTGGPWDEHVHSRMAYGESLTANGQPYGGNTVWPTRLRCVSCRATDPGDVYGNGDGQFDYKDASGAKYYTRFYHGRWMRG